MSESLGHTGKGMKLHTKILIGLVVGLILGVAANLTVGPDDPAVDTINRFVAVPLGQIFLRMLFMVVMPLVFASIALGVAGLGDIRKVGRVGGKAVGYFFVTTFLAATLGLVVVNMTRPWERVTPETSAELMDRFKTDASSRVEAAQTTAKFGPETFINIVPRNPIDAAARTDLLGIIFFGLVFGAALTLIAAEKARPMILWLEALNEVVIRIIQFAMKLAPYGVAALIFTVSSRFGFDLLVAVAAYVGTVLFALLLHAGITLFLIIRFGIGLSPLVFLSRVRAAVITAFSTSSSSATLPTALEVSERQVGIPRRIAGFVLPIGSTMCMNGTAIFEGITVIFLAGIFGVALSLPQMVIVVIMSVITAIGAAGVPGGSIPLLVGILGMVGVPGEGIAIVLGVDRILDMSRTTVNVFSDLTATAWVARNEGAWAPSDLPAKAEAAV
ncbi:MAG TPA: dicarboxylate/amino acid:cation symporter [Vicinamibacterales bacterium]|nr:dicarboxylate/amino acid:cation symporter [Vicinamibacterales bacterium]